MAIVKNKDKRTGITYIYESESYWDKEKQQPRAHRHLIGKLDEETGEIVPTDGRGRKRKAKPGADTEPGRQEAEPLKDQLREKEQRILELLAENESLRKDQTELLGKLKDILSVYGNSF